MHGHGLMRGRARTPGAARRRRPRPEPPTRPDAAGPELRVPDPQAPLRALHAGDGGGGVRLHAGGVRAGRRAALRELRAASAPRAIVLRRRLDPAHHRRADDPRRRHPAAAARQHRPARRRHHGAARPRHASRAPPTSRRSTTCSPATCRSPAPTSDHETLDELHRARGPCRPATGPTLPQVHRQPAQGVVRRRGDAGERLRLRLAAADRRRPLAAAVLRPHGRRAR